MTPRSNKAERPRVICHMMTSVDGRIVVDRWPLGTEGRREYEQVHAAYKPDAWMCGRITMEAFAGGVRDEADVARKYDGSAREDFIAEGTHDSFAFAIDASGRLSWQSNDIEGDHVVSILSERVSDDYLAFLRERGVSYLLAGRDDVDVELALRKVRARFGVQTLLLEGGGRINGSLLRAGLIDEVSLLVAPVADGRIGTPALFDVGGGEMPVRLGLKAVERRADDVLWLRYGVHPNGANDR
jgi:2,5-diamino-6-(ribosylamino)-4(3H)-pyrimidinone 5'-phosphate reductase